MNTGNKRKERGLAIAADYGVKVVTRRNRVYRVRSQSHESTWYTVRLNERAYRCTCEDRHAHHRHKSCKHQFAAMATEVAPDFVTALCNKHGINLDQLEDRLLADLSANLPEPTANRLTIVLHCAQDQIEEKMREVIREKTLPHTVTLIIRYHTSGGRHNPSTFDGGELLQVERDGVTVPALTQDPNVAYAWLAANDYQVAGHNWIDVAGYIRRRKSVYTKEEQQ